MKTGISNGTVAEWTRMGLTSYKSGEFFTFKVGSLWYLFRVNETGSQRIGRYKNLAQAQANAR